MIYSNNMMVHSYCPNSSSSILVSKISSMLIRRNINSQCRNNYHRRLIRSFRADNKIATSSSSSSIRVHHDVAQQCQCRNHQQKQRRRRTLQASTPTTVTTLKTTRNQVRCLSSGGIRNDNNGDINMQVKKKKNRGALGGGFTKDGLELFATQLWYPEEAAQERTKRGHHAQYNARSGDSNDINDDDKPNNIYVDLFSSSISKETTYYLETHHSPSSVLGKAYFGSYRFLPERMLLTPYCALTHKTTSLQLPPDDYDNKNNNSDNGSSSFQLHDKFLMWKVVSITPYEIIFEWKTTSGAAAGGGGDGNSSGNSG